MLQERPFNLFSIRSLYYLITMLLGETKERDEFYGRMAHNGITFFVAHNADMFNSITTSDIYAICKLIYFQFDINIFKITDLSCSGLQSSTKTDTDDVIVTPGPINFRQALDFKKNPKI